jgi:hypothetical protein
MKGEAYASEASTDLELDYELVCKIMDDLEKEGQMEATLRNAFAIIDRMGRWCGQ